LSIHLVKGRVVAKVAVKVAAKAKARNLVKAPNPRVVARVVAKAKAQNLVKAPNPRVERDLEGEIFRATTQSVLVSCSTRTRYANCRSFPCAHYLFCFTIIGKTSRRSSYTYKERPAIVEDTDPPTPSPIGLSKGKGKGSPSGPSKGKGKGSPIAPSKGKGSPSSPSKGKGSHSGPSKGKGSHSGPSKGKDPISGPSKGKDRPSGPSKGKGKDRPSSPSKGKGSPSEPTQPTDTDPVPDPDCVDENWEVAILDIVITCSDIGYGKLCELSNASGIQGNDACCVCKNEPVLCPTSAPTPDSIESPTAEVTKDAGLISALKSIDLKTGSSSASDAKKFSATFVAFTLAALALA